jgi:hypothetical protein
MDYVAGVASPRLSKAAPFTASKAAGYLKTIAEAIDFAHRQGTLHE